MQEYTYIAKDTNGKVVKARVEATSPSEAAKLLVSKNLFPVEVKPLDESDFGEKLRRYVQDVRRIKAKDRVILTRQLATLVRAGLPLAKALQILVQQIDNQKLSKIMQGVSNNIQGGGTLANSLAQYPEVFNMIYISMVEAGEMSGNLDETLLRLADQEEKDQAIRSKVRSALTYPVVVLIVLLAVTGLMITMVIPQVANMYVELNQPLPSLTNILITISDFFKGYFYVVLAALALAIYGSRAYIKSDRGRDAFDSLKLHIPAVSIIVKKVYMARFTRTMASLINSGVSVLQALKITSRAINNVHLERAIKEISERVKSGDAISKPIQNNPLFLPLVGQMIEVGEETGSVGDSMNRVASYFESEVDEAMENISSLIEPITMVVLGGIVAFLVAAVLLPIYNLVSNIR
ncbi:MAG: type II secretion system F family protein [Candidatus Saccharimonadales bacterium]